MKREFLARLEKNFFHRAGATAAEPVFAVTNDKLRNDKSRMSDLWIRSSRAICHFSLVIGHLPFAICHLPNLALRSLRLCGECVWLRLCCAVKSPCPPCLRGETGRLAAAWSPSES